MNLNLPIPAVTLAAYYGTVIISLFALYGLGWLLKLGLFKIKEQVSAFSILTCATLGLTTVVTVYSIVVTKGLTANWMLVAMAGYTCVNYCYSGGQRKVVKNYRRSGWYYLGIGLVINLIFFAYFAYRILDFKHGMFQSCSPDQDYYAKMSQYLNLGYENGLLEYNFFKYIAPQPYHYFEIWTNAFFYKLYGLNAVVFSMVSLPMIFDTLIFFALLAVIESRKKLTLAYLLLAFVGFLAADVPTFVAELLPQIHAFAPRLNWPKYLPVYLFALTALTLFLYKYKYEAYLVLLTIPVLSIVPIIAVWGAVGGLLFIDTCRKRSINWTYWGPFLGIVLLYLIYVLQSPERSSSSGETFYWGLFRLYFTQPTVFLLIYSHFILILVFLKSKYLKLVWRELVAVFAIASFLTLTVSILARPYHYDATQFATTILPIVVYVSIIPLFLLTAVSANLTRTQKIGLLGFCGLSLWISFDVYMKDMKPWRPVNYNFEAEILKQVPINQKEYRIGFYIGENGAFGSGGNYVSGIVDAVTIPDMLDYYYNNVYHYSINKGEKEAITADLNTPFRDFYENKKTLAPANLDDDIRLAFIRENKIQYVRIFKTAQPTEYFLEHLTLIAEDTVENQQFYRVNDFMINSQMK
jgi:hypothetical protein